MAKMDTFTKIIIIKVKTRSICPTPTHYKQQYKSYGKLSNEVNLEHVQIASSSLFLFVKSSE